VSERSVILRVNVGLGGFPHFVLLHRRAFRGVGSSAGEKPTGQSTTRTARSATWSRLTRHARLRLVGLDLRFGTLVFDGRSGGLRLRTVAILGE